ncbi:helix-turn-helix transcriptional regulator [Amycolatopsis sp. PS_44_ISF1]|uniref:response regulator transcription factor n=1 Tax=Amycolatopsis sp. PS_44_ISF1 TaxID=2974917 RepID=UPI0028DE971A|nr:helix-turn-helix transcriptional regulator [Amycolatopsis sp. PS_44_ISF1]MDT8912739.1 helix-turn-helix transcriptional regulator [Amycolatopsis sp. PS_44_ISF1]
MKYSPREMEVLSHLADGLTYASIARRMKISLHTVDEYIRRIKKKSGSLDYYRLRLLAVNIAKPEHP